MKKSFFLMIFILIFNPMQLESFDDEAVTNELEITNSSSDIIKVSVYPVGTVFNGEKEYKLLCEHPVPSPNPVFFLYYWWREK
jgi:hypothetical protein